MKKVTQKDYQSFIQIYKGLPERSAVKAPKTEFVEEIAALCMCSTKTVRMWIHGDGTILYIDGLSLNLNFEARSEEHTSELQSH